MGFISPELKNKFHDISLLYDQLRPLLCCLDFLQRAAELLCVPADELQTCLRVRMLKAGRHSVLKPCSPAECSMRRDCLAKVVFAQ